VNIPPEISRGGTNAWAVFITPVVELGKNWGSLQPEIIKKPDYE
jgi:hypothetical protein